MYEYRNLSPAQRKEALSLRRQRKLPLHTPPHYPDDKRPYLITGTCYEHRPILHEEPRRLELKTKLIDQLDSFDWADVRAWVILANHYHILVSLNLELFQKFIGRLHNGLSTQWNREDSSQGRKVWRRFQDRRIRNERHYFASLNYIHANPVRHDYVQKAQDWTCSSIHQYLRQHGREAMLKVWKKYPVNNYGKGWDW